MCILIGWVIIISEQVWTSFNNSWANLNNFKTILNRSGTGANRSKSVQLVYGANFLINLVAFPLSRILSHPELFKPVPDLFKPVPNISKLIGDGITIYRSRLVQTVERASWSWNYLYVIFYSDWLNCNNFKTALDKSATGLDNSRTSLNGTPWRIYIQTCPGTDVTQPIRTSRN